jgi:hypothetical protein
LDRGQNRRHGVHGTPFVLDDVQTETAIGEHWTTHTENTR